MFKLYDALLFTGRPASSVWGAEPLKIFYQQFVLDPGGIIPSQAVLNQRTATHANFNGIICFDIEGWLSALDSAAIANANALYAQLAGMLHIACPLAKIGYYGFPPNRNYWGPVQHLSNPTAYNLWKSQNTQLQPITNGMDIGFPSLYTFYGTFLDDISNWEIYARENIAEAKRNMPGKPIYPFIWPQFHDSNVTIGGQLISGPFWRMQLDILLKTGCAGAVIWGGNQVAWNNNSPWYLELKDFAITRPPDMPLTKAQILQVNALKLHGFELVARIAEIQASTLQQLQAELADVNTQLQAIDPTIPPVA